MLHNCVRVSLMIVIPYTYAGFPDFAARCCTVVMPVFVDLWHIRRGHGHFGSFLMKIYERLPSLSGYANTFFGV